jgi:hypothetical protein
MLPGVFQRQSEAGGYRWTHVIPLSTAANHTSSKCRIGQVSLFNRSRSAPKRMGRAYNTPALRTSAPRLPVSTTWGHDHNCRGPACLSRPEMVYTETITGCQHAASVARF